MRPKLNLYATGVLVMAASSLYVATHAFGKEAVARHTAPPPPRPAPTIAAHTARTSVLLGRRLAVHGRVSVGGRVVALQTRSHGRWHSVAWARAGRLGRFRVTFEPHRLGRYPLRVATAGAHAARVRAGEVFHLAGASWYGPGGSLACGGTLSSSTLGVANKTLPCGTMVLLRYGRHSVRVPVIDRGPYVAGRDYDLTPATRRALGFGDVGDIWATA